MTNGTATLDRNASQTAPCDDDLIVMTRSELNDMRRRDFTRGMIAQLQASSDRVLAATG